MRAEQDNNGRPPTRGRPPLGDRARSIRLEVKIDRDTMTALRVAASAAGTTMSSYVYDLIVRSITQPDPDQR